jgi:hypothetical protein
MGAASVWPLRGLALVAFAFGLATVRAGGSVLFGDGAAAAGNFFPFVVWFNFIAGFFYVAAAAGLWRRAAWAAWLAAALAVLTALVFGAVGVQIALGAPFELRTVVAMSARTLLWTALAVLAWPARQPAAAEGQIV